MPRQHLTRQSGLARRGFTLVELLFVMAIMGIITTHILGVFTSQLASYEGQRAVTAVQDDARLAADLIFHDLRMSGFMVPPESGVAGVDGGTAGSDRLCVSDPSVLDDDQVDIAKARFPGAALTGNLGPNQSNANLSAANRDIDGDGSVDFTVGSGIIIVDGTNSHCALITSMGPTQINFTPNTPGLFAANVPVARAVPAIIYERTTAGLVRNTLLLSRQVEDLQVEYGVDINGDGQLTGAEFPIDGLHGNDPSRLRIVRFSVLTRTVLEDPNMGDGAGRPAVANHAAGGVQDGFRRRLVTASAAPRNVL